MNLAGTALPCVRLTPAEQRIVRFIARERSDANRRERVADGRIGPQSSEATDLIGFAAELAFCRLFNCYPDLDTRTRSGSVDCTRFGQAIDVKGTTYPNGRLLAVPKKGVLEADVYALILVDWAYGDEASEIVCQFAGFAHARDLLSNLGDLGHGPTCVMAQAQLAPQQSLPFDRRRTSQGV
jgi:hypothetical protein